MRIKLDNIYYSGIMFAHLNKHWNRKMTYDEYVENAKEAAALLDTYLKENYSENEFSTKAEVKQILGKVLVVVIHRVPLDSKPIDKLNAPTIKLMMHLSDDKGRTTDLDKFSFEKVNSFYGFDGLKYRKISNKTPVAVAGKLINWLQKNDKIIRGGEK